MDAIRRFLSDEKIPPDELDEVTKQALDELERLQRIEQAAGEFIDEFLQDERCPNCLNDNAAGHEDFCRAGKLNDILKEATK